MVRHVTGLFVVLVILLLSGAAGCRPSYPSAFKESAMYWRGLKGPGGIDSAELANRIAPMINPGGVGYLLDKMDRGSEDEREIAVVCLATIYEILLDNPDEESRRLREPIDKSALLKKVAVFAEKGSNEAIRSVLLQFGKMPKREAVTPAEVPVSGQETWTVGGRTYRIHDTRIMMRSQKGPLFVVVIDQSRGAIHQLIDSEPEVAPRRAIAKYALDNGYFRKAKEIRVGGTGIELQDSIDVWFGGKARDGYGTVSSFEGGWDVRELEGKALPNEQADGTRP